MKEQKELVKIRAFVKQQYATTTVSALHLHTYKRVKKMVKAATFIADRLSLSHEDRLLVLQVIAFDR